ncbi:3-methyl-2-oxobutanoate hydroxymethyltransferase [Dysgonomonas sp. 511]|uniref:3-methyl-2-oxobutanoate hydroxymethyltransferase n=1 Tax=Dysgonomonas sp. 511 TaxID=2302930 RepID=UPI0013D83B56|nr:3-methyl-2-oxobutanoate hydroxymethyltransferase [Dysgonomonas sp. 511]NDV79394.1 3-methyl-2-oxobutanoate hydroxymethyltransferase [Dysgonomonas sp. 511]
MSTYTENIRKITVRHLAEMKQLGEKITMLTAYDYTMASIIDQAGMDVVLIGDSASNVMAGNLTTLPMTLDQMIYHGRSVVNGVKHAMVIVDMPFGTVSGNPMKSLEAAIRMIKETGADALKIEGGEEIIEDIRKIVNAGIPVMGHLGLMPQSVNKYGGYAIRAKDTAEADKLLRDVQLLQEAGCFGVVLEKIPAELAKKATAQTTMATIGIGAGADTDGQVLVVQDMLGMNKGFAPKFLRKYADIHTVMTEAVQGYIKDVKAVDFPNKEESY